MKWRDSDHIKQVDYIKNDEQPEQEDEGSSSIKQSQQFKALFMKNLRLQSKQKGTNLCQILTPILCILFTFLMKTIAEQNMRIGAVYQSGLFPIKFDNYTQLDKFNQQHLRKPSFRNKTQWVTYTCPKNQENQCHTLIGNISQYYNETVDFHPDPIHNSSMVVKMPIPFFLQCNETSINEMLFQRTSWLSEQNLTKMNKSGGFQFIPDGAYDITSMEGNTLNFGVKINDLRDLSILRKNGIQKIGIARLLKSPSHWTQKVDYVPNLGILAITNWLISAFIKTKNSSIEMNSGVLFMPEDQSGMNFLDTLLNFVAVMIFPIALSLLFPVFLYTVVLEKQEKLIQMMKMNGMKISSYWVVYFAFNFVLSLLTNGVFVVMGIILTKMTFFTESDPILIIVVLVGWSLAQIGMAVFFQTFLNKSRSATIIGYLISIWTSMIGATLSIGIYQYPRPFPMWLRCFAFFGFPRIIYLMLSGCSDGECFGNVGHIPEQMVHQIIMLYINFIVFFMLGAYLFEVVPQEFGVRKNPFFPIIVVRKFIMKMVLGRDDGNSGGLEYDTELKKYVGGNDEDSFSKKEREELVNDDNVTQNNPLVINNLRKLYWKVGRKKVFAAVKSFNLKVGPKQTFGLLGPNGAGKTTLISMITGMFEPNFGNAWVAGYDIRTSVEKAQLEMGVCPQFDLLWPQLTVEEHLYFYARLKGISRKVIDLKVSKAIQQVKLTTFKSFPSSSLSGGMRRRLSIAISLVGDPKIVFLDQPSTGLDPQNRRHLWEILARCQKKRAIFITTHMMQQADVLCNRVGIITKGVLRTVAPQVTLKKQYGGGYRVSMSIPKQDKKFVDSHTIPILERIGGQQVQDNPNQPQKQQSLRRSVNSFLETQEREIVERTRKRVTKITSFLQNQFPGTILLKQYNGYLIYKVKQKFKVSQIFETLHNRENQLQVVDVAITNSSLEDVFINVVIEHQGESSDEDDLIHDRENFGDDNAKCGSMDSNKYRQSGALNLNATPKVSQNFQPREGSSIISKNRVSEISNDAQLGGGKRRYAQSGSSDSLVPYENRVGGRGEKKGRRYGSEEQDDEE